MNIQKQLVAKAALEHIKPRLYADTIIGIGTGSTVEYFIDMLQEHKNKFAGCVSSSNASTKQLQALGIEVHDLNAVQEITYYVDGADEANDKLQLIKGGGAALTREKILAAVSKQFICIVDSSKKVAVLGDFPLPIEIIPMARSYVAQQILSLNGKPVHRTGVITDNGNEIIDVHGLHILNPRELESKINNITGVITNGIFAHRPADILIIANTNNNIEKLQLS